MSTNRSRRIDRDTAEQLLAGASGARATGPEHLAEADSLVRVIRDEDLRKVVAKAAALSLANADNDRSFW